MRYVDSGKNLEGTNSVYWMGVILILITLKFPFDGRGECGRKIISLKLPGKLHSGSRVKKLEKFHIRGRDKTLVRMGMKPPNERRVPAFFFKKSNGHRDGKPDLPSSQSKAASPKLQTQEPRLRADVLISN